MIRLSAVSRERIHTTDVAEVSMFSSSKMDGARKCDFGAKVLIIRDVHGS